MYRPSVFDCPDRGVMVDIIRANGFAVLVSAGADGMVASHVPLHLTEDDGEPVLWGHLAKANDQWKRFDGAAEALAVFQGPHAYVSPRWYAADNLVPTWNYVAVHAYGRPRVIDDEARVVRLLTALTDQHEAGAERPWRVGDLPADLVAAQIKGIVAFEMPIERLEGKRKLSQNRRPDDAIGAMDGLRGTGRESDAATAAAMMAVLGDKTS